MPRRFLLQFGLAAWAPAGCSAALAATTALSRTTRLAHSSLPRFDERDAMPVLSWQSLLVAPDRDATLPAWLPIACADVYVQTTAAPAGGERIYGCSSFMWLAAAAPCCCCWCRPAPACTERAASDRARQSLCRRTGRNTLLMLSFVLSNVKANYRVSLAMGITLVCRPAGAGDVDGGGGAVVVARDDALEVLRLPAGAGAEGPGARVYQLLLLLRRWVGGRDERRVGGGGGVGGERGGRVVVRRRQHRRLVARVQVQLRVHRRQLHRQELPGIQSTFQTRSSSEKFSFFFTAGKRKNSTAWLPRPGAAATARS